MHEIKILVLGLPNACFRCKQLGHYIKDCPYNPSPMKKSPQIGKEDKRKSKEEMEDRKGDNGKDQKVEKEASTNQTYAKGGHDSALGENKDGQQDHGDDLNESKNGRDKVVGKNQEGEGLIRENKSKGIEGSHLRSEASKDNQGEINGSGMAMEVAELVSTEEPRGAERTSESGGDKGGARGSALDDPNQGFQQVKRKNKKNREPLGTRSTVRFKVSAPMYTVQT